MRKAVQVNEAGTREDISTNKCRPGHFVGIPLREVAFHPLLALRCAAVRRGRVIRQPVVVRRDFLEEIVSTRINQDEDIPLLVPDITAIGPVLAESSTGADGQFVK